MLKMPPLLPPCRDISATIHAAACHAAYLIDAAAAAAATPPLSLMPMLLMML